MKVKKILKLKKFKKILSQRNYIYLVMLKGKELSQKHYISKDHLMHKVNTKTLNNRISTYIIIVYDNI